MPTTKKKQLYGLYVLLGLVITGLIVAALLWANSGTPKDVNNREEPTRSSSPGTDR
jgi:hypothetical protein